MMYSQNDTHDFSWPVAVFSWREVAMKYFIKGQGHFEGKQFQELEIGRHTAKSAHCVSCSLVVLTDPEPKDIAMNLITCHVPFIPGKLSQRARS